jgi:hypothetical protein
MPLRLCTRIFYLNHSILSKVLVAGFQNLKKLANLLLHLHLRLNFYSSLAVHTLFEDFQALPTLLQILIHDTLYQKSLSFIYGGCKNVSTAFYLWPIIPCFHL